MSTQIFPGDNLLEWIGAYDELAAEYLDGDATVTLSLYTDDDGEPGTAIAEDVAMSYVAASDGNFAGVLESAVTAGLTIGSYYWIKATATSGSIVGVREWRVRFVRRGPKK